MSYVQLDRSLLLAKGGERICYIHPNDNTKIIKVLYTKGTHNNQNELEYIYYEYLNKYNIDLSSISKCYDYIDTNKGKGLVFERIMDFDGKPSKSFRYLIANKLLPYDVQEQLILELKEYLDKNLILFVDTSLTNIFCKKIEDNKYKLIIIDGLGAKRLGMKFWLYRNSKFYTKYKIKRQWSKFMVMYKKDIKRIKLGTMPMHRL